VEHGQRADGHGLRGHGLRAIRLSFVVLECTCQKRLGIQVKEMYPEVGRYPLERRAYDVSVRNHHSWTFVSQGLREDIQTNLWGALKSRSTLQDTLACEPWLGGLALQ
jgi:hypothetical protein